MFSIEQIQYSTVEYSTGGLRLAKMFCSIAGALSVWTCQLSPSQWCWGLSGV